MEASWSQRTWEACSENSIFCRVKRRCDVLAHNDIHLHKLDICGCHAEICTALRREHDFCKRSDPQAGFLANKLARATGTCSKNPIFHKEKQRFCSLHENDVGCCYAKICTALRREQDLWNCPAERLETMLSGPYVLWDRTKMRDFT